MENLRKCKKSLWGDPQKGRFLKMALSLCVAQGIRGVAVGKKT